MTHGTPPRLPAVLAPYVTAVVPYDLDMGPPGVHRGMPGPGLTFELPLDEPLDVSWAGQDHTRRQAWSCVSGLHTRPAAIHHDGHQRGVSVSLTLRGARALLGVPAGELAGQLVSLPEVAPHLAHLPELLAQSPTTATVARVLVRRLAQAGEPGPRAEVGRALALIARGGQVRDVAAEQGWSRRHLQDLVRAECGLTPRDLRRVARLARSRGGLVVAARSAAARSHRANLADVAASAGYADHAHMTREWVALAGCTPSTWLREEFPYVQDVADPARASWEAPEHASEQGGPR